MGIDWTQVGYSAAVGAFIGGLAALVALAYRRLAPRFGRVVSAVGIALVMVAAGTAVVYSPLGKRWADTLAKRRSEARFARLMGDAILPVVESPAFRERAEGLGEAEVQALALELSSQGLLRLPDVRLVRRTELLGDALAAADEEICAAQLIAPDPEQVQKLLGGLPDASLREWAQIAADASMASLRDDPQRTPSSVEAQQAVQRLLAVLPEEDSGQLLESLGDLRALDSARACWTARAIYRAFAELPEAERGPVARVLAVQ